ncbi:hypothetical protein MPH_06326 [Macrophomina phaseolina MS6]|uniref:Uncharacterized protein n=1 Tax=Macrophomina phaseolina (strain MS6) TaxID=1126212 RepID=K2SIE0_MACPH|nr:hypothetical protein MPH_06326 [Macrophomina phaseolina MS6]
MQSIWREIRYDSTFDATRGPALATADKEKDTPLHILLRSIAENINQSLSNPEFHGLIFFAQAFSEGDDDERLHLHMRDKHGGIQTMSFANALSRIYACKEFKQEASATILNILNILSNAQRSRRLHQEKDYEEKTYLHHVAVCRTNFRSRK